MACCNGDHCPIQQHHHHQNAPAHHSDMECEHGMSEMMNCSMACCENSEKPLVTAVAFVLPNLAQAFAREATVTAAEPAHAVAIPRSVKPVTPPPRFTRPS
jgi:hypothetical protein